jgi:hypothetical protein
MSGIIIESEEKKTNPFLGVLSHLGMLYILILGISLGIVYYQGVYQDNSLTISIPFTDIWPLALIAVGLSIFRVKSSASLSVGVFLMVLAVTITMFSVFIGADAIDTNIKPIKGSINGAKSIYTDIATTSTDISIKGGGADIDGQYIANYGTLTNTIALDKYASQNISIEQLDIQPGFGSYSKKVDLILPNNIPAIFNITANISPLSLDLKGILFKSANITLRGSRASIIMDQVEKTATLSITSTASQVTIIIPRNIKVLLSTSDSFANNDFIGLIQKEVDSRIYESSNYQVLDGEEEKTVTVNLNSTFSQIKVIQK